MLDRHALPLLLAAALAVAAPAPSRAAGASTPRAGAQLLVLRIDGPAALDPALDAATERVGTRALAMLRGKLQILTRDVIAAVVPEAVLQKCTDEARCELDLGAAVGASWVLGGRVVQSGDATDLTVKLYDVGHVALAAQSTARLAPGGDLATLADALASEVLARAFRLGPGVAGALTDEGCPAGMRRIPGGTFTLLKRGDEVTVAAACLDVTEVTSAAYAECVGAKRCAGDGLACGAAATAGRPDRENHPANCVTWDEAVAYCAWAGKRLPSEEEWEWAARGAAGATRFPWGDAAPGDRACWNGDGNAAGRGNRQGTCPVGASEGGASPQGLVDLAGNVWEWTATAWGEGRVYRGGAFTTTAPVFLQGGSRYWLSPTQRDAGVGFRCAVAPTERVGH